MPPKRTPDQIYAELFEAVQSSRAFADSKTFVDAIPNTDPAEILESFRDTVKGTSNDLSAFVMANFHLPALNGKQFSTRPGGSVRQHIELLWDVLTRIADIDNPNSSLIALPQPYIVPGGRFREIYYWDSYFTMLGLASSGRVDLIDNMVTNFAFLIDRIGYIPNGNRTYYATRSQPPFFALMVELLANVKQERGVYVRFLRQLRTEYDFWMAGADDLSGQDGANRRVIAVDGSYLNRYWDHSDRPRPESHFEDRELAAKSGRKPAAGLYRDIRAACESGWDFSSRWLEDEESLASIRTSQIVPVDLNAVLFKLESVIALASGIAGDAKCAKFFQQRAGQRRHLIQSLFFDAQSGFFRDLVLPDLSFSNTQSLASAYPLFFRLATAAQGKCVAEKIHNEFLKTGGWVTTLNHSGQQWDAPNGWAPLQWLVYVGLRNYDFSTEAESGAKRWVANNLRVYEHSGELLEKYNVEQVGSPAVGGEYATQDGFGWTNGVLLSFMDELGME